MRGEYGDAVRRVSRPLMQAFNLTSDRTEQVVTRLIAPAAAALGLAVGLAAFTPEDHWFALAASALLALFAAGGAIVAGKSRAVIWFAPLAVVAAHAFRLGLVPEDWTAAVLTPMALIGAAGAALYLIRRVTPLDALIALLGVVIPFVMVAGDYGFEGSKTYAGLLGVLLAGPYLFLFSRRDHVLGLAVAVGGYLAATQPMSAVSDWHYAGAGLVALGLFLGGRFMSMRSVRSETRRFIDGLYVAALASIVFAPFWSEQTTLAVWLWAVLTSAVVALPMVSGPLRASAHSIMWAVLSAAVLTTVLRELPESDIYDPLAYTVMAAVALGLAHGVFLLSQRLVLGGVRPFGQVFGALYLGAVLAGITAGVTGGGWSYSLLPDYHGEDAPMPGWLAEAVRVYGGLAVASLGAYVISARRRELDVIPVYRGLMTNRQAAFTRRVYRSLEETIPRIPLINVFGAIVAAGAEFLRHVRNNRGTPVVTELFVIGAAVAGYLLYSAQFLIGAPIPILPEGLWSAVTDALGDAEAYSFMMSFGVVGYGVMLFLAGRLLRLRLLVYLALLATLAPFLMQAFAAFSYTTTGLVMASAIAAAQGLLGCEIMRALTIWNNEAPAKLRQGERTSWLLRLGPAGMLIGLFAVWVGFFGLGQFAQALDGETAEDAAPAAVPDKVGADEVDVDDIAASLADWDEAVSLWSDEQLLDEALSLHSRDAYKAAADAYVGRAGLIAGLAAQFNDGNDAAAGQRYENACYDGESRACYNYGVLLFNETPGLSLGRDDARAFIREACDDYIALACAALGSLAEIDGEERAVAEAHYARACALGHETSCRAGQANQDVSEQVGLLKADLDLRDDYFSSAPGDLLADWALSIFGLEALEQAAGENHPRSLVVLGLAHDVGLGGFSPDQSKAAELYRRACELGELRGCSNHGAKQFDGLGVPEQAAEGAAQFRKACEAGLAIGCSNLATAYLDGKGVEQDAEEGRSLLVQACAGGYGIACRRLEATPEDDAP